MLSLFLFLTIGQNLPVQTISTEKLVKMSIVRYALLYSVPVETLDAVVKCESYYGRYQLNTKEKHGESRGVAQFRQSTFDYYSKMAGIKGADVWDVEDSIQTMAFMVNIGEGRHWTCYRNLQIL